MFGSFGVVIVLVLLSIWIIMMLVLLYFKGLKEDV